MESVIRATEVTREFKSGGGVFRALHNVSLDIPQKSLTMIKGRSGSGKTTLINILGALDYPTHGAIEFGGQDIARMEERQRSILRRKNIGFVFQSVALVSVMTALENVEFALRLAGFPAQQRRQRAEYCLQLVGLGGRMRHMPQELSGGEQQRVAIARAIAHRPKLVFADEPTAELDSDTGLAVIQTFHELVDNEGLSIIMTTHNPEQLSLGDCVFELEDGELLV